MFKILKYSIYDLSRSRWSYVYLLFYLALALVLLFLNNSLSKAIITLMNVIVVLTPMIGTIFGIMYYYNSREFIELLLCQPVKRSSIFIGLYLGIAASLSASLILGLGVPFLIYGITMSSEIWNFMMLIVVGTLLTFVFSGLSLNIALINNNKIKGFGYAVLVWLFFSVIYDGILMTLLIVFNEYPLDRFTLISSLLNPIDLSRILILLKLDISALLGYTGAVFNKFFGTSQGTIISGVVLVLWSIGPVALMLRTSGKKDF